MVRKSLIAADYEAISFGPFENHFTQRRKKPTSF